MLSAASQCAICKLHSRPSILTWIARGICPLCVLQAIPLSLPCRDVQLAQNRSITSIRHCIAERKDVGRSYNQKKKGPIAANAYMCAPTKATVGPPAIDECIAGHGARETGNMGHECSRFQRRFLLVLRTCEARKTWIWLSLTTGAAQREPPVSTKNSCPSTGVVGRHLIRPKRSTFNKMLLLKAGSSGSKNFTSTWIETKRKKTLRSKRKVCGRFGVQSSPRHPFASMKHQATLNSRFPV